jgi:phenylacetate-CoA ligase
MNSSELRAPSEHDTGSLFDPFWDYGPRSGVDTALAARFARQLESALRTKAFAERFYARAPRVEARFRRADIESFPVLSKHDLRALAPDELLVDPLAPFYMVRTTGGTTGAPVPIFWTRDDWRALVQALHRFCPRGLLDEGTRRVWNGYNQSHISGPAFDDLVRALGATPVPRQHGSSDREALQAMERMRVSALVITPQAGSGKGGSLEDLLAEDPSFLARLGIQTLLVSSTRLRADLLQELREQGVTNIVNFYGSTEGPPAAVSCEEDPTAFHLAQGHVLVEIVDADGRHVKSGERGTVLISRVASATSTGLAAAGGTQLLRYAIGDTASYVDEPCACGRSSARIMDVERVAYLDDKLKGGCERWE